jgi:hypothetical protein
MTTITTLLNSLATSPELRERIAVLARQVRVESHNDLFLLLRQFCPTDLQRFVELWSKVTPAMRSDFVTFVLTGDVEEKTFLRYREDDYTCRAAVDMAFSAHIDSLRDLGKSLAEAGPPAASSWSADVVSILSETEKAEESLLSAEAALGRTGKEPNHPLLLNLQLARSAVDRTKRGLMALAGISA